MAGWLEGDYRYFVVIVELSGTGSADGNRKERGIETGNDFRRVPLS